jgi:hypothetical protein
VQVGGIVVVNVYIPPLATDDPRLPYREALDTLLSRIRVRLPRDLPCVFIGDMNAASPQWPGPRAPPSSDKAARGDEIARLLNLGWKLGHPPGAHPSRGASLLDLALLPPGNPPPLDWRCETRFRGSDHLAVAMTFPAVVPTLPPKQHVEDPTWGWRYDKASWAHFARETDAEVLAPSPPDRPARPSLDERMEGFVRMVVRAARRTIPGGVVLERSPGLSGDALRAYRQCEDGELSLEQLRDVLASEADRRARSRGIWRHVQLLQRTTPPRPSDLASVAATFAGVSAPIPLAPATTLDAIRPFGVPRPFRPRQPAGMPWGELTRLEYECAVLALRQGKAADPDTLTAELILGLGPYAKSYLFQLLAEVMRTKRCPRSWKRSIVVPIHKRDDEWRPIALVSVLSKLYESIVQNRLIEYLETHSLVSRHQHGFRRHRGTVTALAPLTHFLDRNCRGAPEHRHGAHVAAVDFSSAFNRLVPALLVDRLRFLGVHPDCVAFLQCYLSGRSQKVRGTEAFIGTENGCPQGTVIGPLLWVLYVDILLERLEKAQVDFTCYADDLTLFSTSKDQLAYGLKVVHAWSQEFGVPISPKTSLVHVRGPRAAASPSAIQPLWVGGMEFKYSDSTKILGLVFDSALSFAPHLAMTLRKAMLPRAVLARAVTSCAPNLSASKSLYHGTVAAVCLYGAELWIPFLNLNQKKEVATLLHEAARLALGVPVAAPTAVVLELLGVPPLEELLVTRSAKLLLTLGALGLDRPLPTVRQGTNSRNASEFTRPNASWAGRSTFVDLATKALSAVGITSCEALNFHVLPLGSSPRVFPTLLPHDQCRNDSGNDCEGDEVTPLKLAANALMETMALHYATHLHPHLPFTVAWCDASVKPGIRKEDWHTGGAAVIGEHMAPSVLDRVLSHASSAYACSYRAEAYALLALLHSFLAKRPPSGKVCVLTDSLSLLLALNVPVACVRDGFIFDIMCALHDLETKGVVVLLFFLYGHAGSYGNDAADGEAKLNRGECTSTRAWLPDAICAVRRWFKREQPKLYTSGLRSILVRACSLAPGRYPMRAMANILAGTPLGVGTWMHRVVPPPCRFCGTTDETLAHTLLCRGNKTPLPPSKPQDLVDIFTFIEQEVKPVDPW